VLGFGVLGYLLYRRKQQLKQLLLSFINFEGILIAEVIFDGW
jgi:hypothetical protein